MPIQLKNASLSTLASFPNVHIFATDLPLKTTVTIKITSISSNNNIGYANIEFLNGTQVIGQGAYSFDNSNPEDIDAQIYAFLKTLPEFTGAIDC
jgi:hypothetical protein